MVVHFNMYHEMLSNVPMHGHFGCQCKLEQESLAKRQYDRVLALTKATQSKHPNILDIKLLLMRQKLKFSSLISKKLSLRLTKNISRTWTIQNPCHLPNRRLSNHKFNVSSKRETIFKCGGQIPLLANHFVLEHLRIG